MNLPAHSTMTYRRTMIAAMVLLLLAMQSTLAYLVTPMANSHAEDDKVTIVLCTLQGLQEIEIDLGDDTGSAQPQYCPALELHDLIATGVAAAVIDAVIPPIPRSLRFSPRTTPDYRSENYPAFSGRAPPIA